MILRRLQKGQSVIEFALVLPLFLLLVMGIFYFGMVMADYLALSSIARSSAREASVIVEKDKVKKNYLNVKENYKDYKLPIDIYDWNPDIENNFNIRNVKINSKDESTNVVVTINATLNKNGSMLANIVNKLADMTNKNTTLNITYTMYSEYKSK